ncbi:Nn.00g113260.m01.CDS01 [Neocucurbitaria sp. VM-36]
MGCFPSSYIFVYDDDYYMYQPEDIPDDMFDDTHAYTEHTGALHDSEKVPRAPDQNYLKASRILQHRKSLAYVTSAAVHIRSHESEKSG